MYLSARDEELFRGRGASSYRGTVKARLSCEGFPPDELDELERTDACLIPRVEWPMPERFANLADGDELRYGATGCAPSTRRGTRRAINACTCPIRRSCSTATTC